MVAYRLRPATADDAEVLFRIHRGAMADHLAQAFGPWTDGFAREQHEKWLRTGRPQVVMVGGETFGVLDVEWQPDAARLHRIEIGPEFHGRGVGTAILRDLLRECCELHIPARLAVFLHNPARRLYQRLGFREVRIYGPSIEMQWDPPNETQAQ
jgi:ribosomal protein S18 acetylase RimI-like enzyme